MEGLLIHLLYPRLAGYEDTNDAEGLRNDPGMRAVIGPHALAKDGAGETTVGRFEKEILLEGDNMGNLEGISMEWAEKMDVVRNEKETILDIDSSESPVHGEQEGVTYNGHFGMKCYHPLFLFNSHGGGYFQNDKLPPMIKGGQSGNKINYGRGKKVSHFGIFSERIFKGNRCSKYFRSYKGACLLVKEEGRGYGIDDATNEVPFALFFLKDGTIENMIVLKEIFIRKGLPLSIYLDRDSKFITTRKGGLHVELKDGVHEKEDTNCR